MSRREHVSARLRVGLIGLGAWGSRLLLALARLERSQVVAVCDVDASRLARAAATIARGGARPPLTTRDAGALLESPGLHAAVIATPPSTHAALVHAALEHGLHVFVEKPLATSLEAAIGVARRATLGGKVVMVGHILEHHPAVTALAALIGSGALGAPRALVCRRLGAIRRDEDAWWSLAPHDLGLVHRLLGAPVSIRVTAPPDGCDRRLARLRTERGGLARVEVGYGHPRKVRSVALACSGGAALFDDLEPRHKLRVRVASGEWRPLDVEGTEPLLLECRRFEAAVLDAVDPLTSARAGAEVVRWLAAGDVSLRSGTTVHLGSRGAEPARPDASLIASSLRSWPGVEASA